MFECQKVAGDSEVVFFCSTQVIRPKSSNFDQLGMLSGVVFLDIDGNRGPGTGKNVVEKLAQAPHRIHSSRIG